MKWIVIIFLAMAIVSCRKDQTANPITPVETTKLVVRLNHFWQNSTTPFLLNTEYINSSNNDTLEFLTFKYYVSNLKFLNDSGNWWIHPESYFLIDLSNESTKELVINDIPAGNYVEMQYTLGVDSLRNVSGAQTGALSVSNGMFWTWNTGYIMLKAEGVSPNSSSGSFSYHLGGFESSTNIVSTRTENFGGDTLKISLNDTSYVNFNAYPNTLFDFIGSVSSTNQIQATGIQAKNMSKGFYTSIHFTSF